MVNIRTLFVSALMACPASSVASDNQSVNAAAVYGDAYTYERGKARAGTRWFAF